MKNLGFVLILVAFAVGCSKTVPTMESLEQEVWKQLYADYIENIQKEMPNAMQGTNFSLGYILNNDIPGLIINYPGASGGGVVVVFDVLSKQLVTQPFSRNNIKYIEKEGRIINSDGNMGYYYDKIFEFQNGEFVLIFNGLRIESEFFVSDNEVAFDEYSRLLMIAEPSVAWDSRYFPIFKNAKSISESYPTEEIVSIIMSYNE